MQVTLSVSDQLHPEKDRGHLTVLTRRGQRKDKTS